MVNSKLKFIDLFCGIGGFHSAVKKLNKNAECVFACDIDKHAIETYEKNHGIKVTTDIRKVEAKDIPSHDLLCAGFPCFIAGTMVLTQSGYKPIEEIVEGEFVLTHKGRWRKVTATMSKNNADVFEIKAQGVPGIVCTKEHPFFIKSIVKNKVYTDYEFVEAEKLNISMYLTQILPEEIVCDRHSLEFWYFIGRYLAEGWTVKRNDRKCGGRVVICGNKNEEQELKQLIESAGFHGTPSIERTVIKYHITNNSLYEFVQQFGKYAYGKKIPGWIFSLNQTKIKSLIDGYMSGDGTRGKDCYKANSTSKSLALSIALLSQKAYTIVASCIFCKRPETYVIEGRVVNQRSYWITTIPDRNRSGHIDGKYGCKKYRKTTYKGKATVYNISVEEDESYLADGAIVHNCQPFSIGGKQNGFSEARGTLFFEIERILRHHKTKYILLENVKNLISHDKGNTWRVITNILKDIGYRLTAKPLILCPSQIGTPQLRPRVFIAGIYDPENVNVPLDINIKKKPLQSVYDLLENTVDPKYNISKEEENILEVWNDFVEGIGNLDCIGLTVIPEYFKLDSKNIDSSYPKWKKKDIVKNVALYNKHKTFIDKWLKKHNNLEDLPPSRRRMEWHANTTIKSVYDGFIQIRQSGVRVKKPTAFPTLVAIVQTSIIGKLKRRLTPRECARLQNFSDNFILCPKDYQAYKQLGNSVNVNVIYSVLSQIPLG